MHQSFPMMLLQQYICFLFLTTIGMQSGATQGEDSKVVQGGGLLHTNTKIERLLKANTAGLSLSIEWFGKSVSLHPKQMIVDEVSHVDGNIEIVGHESTESLEIHYALKIPGAGGVSHFKVSTISVSQDRAPTLNLVLYQGSDVSLPKLFGLASMYSYVRPIFLNDDNQFELVDFLEVEGSSCDGCWIGYRTQSHAYLVSGTVLRVLNFLDSDNIETLSLGQSMTQEDIRGLAGFSSEILIYNNPVEYQAILQADDPALMNLMYSHLWDWVRYIVFSLRTVTYFLFSLTGSWGVAIILLAICIRLLITPISELAAKYQREALLNQQLLKPFIDDIKRQYKGEEQSKKLFELYAQHNIHPLSGFKAFFGLAVQIPIFVAIFALLGELQPLVGTGFLWVNDLSLPDALFSLPFAIPLLGDSFNLMPFIMTLIAFVSAFFILFFCCFWRTTNKNITAHPSHILFFRHSNWL